MLEDICDGSQSHANVNKREASYKIRDCIRQIKLECKGALKSTRNMGKGLHKVFKTVVKDIQQELPPLGESGSEVFRFIPELRNFAVFLKLSDYIRKPWLNETQNYIKNLINNRTFIFGDIKKGEPVTPCMDVHKAKVQSNGIIYKLNLRIFVRRYLENK